MLCETISITGNPLEDDSPEVLVRNCATAGVIDTVRNIKATGQSQYQDYRISSNTLRPRIERALK